MLSKLLQQARNQLNTAQTGLLGKEGEEAECHRHAHEITPTPAPPKTKRNNCKRDFGRNFRDQPLS